MNRAGGLQATALLISIEFLQFYIIFCFLPLFKFWLKIISNIRESV